MNRLISHGHATRSTLAFSRVTHFMAPPWAAVAWPTLDVPHLRDELRGSGTRRAGRRRRPAPCASAAKRLQLLDLDRGALVLERALGVVGHVLGDLLQDRRRRALHEVL